MFLAISKLDLVVLHAMSVSVYKMQWEIQSIRSYQSCHSHNHTLTCRGLWKFRVCKQFHKQIYVYMIPRLKHILISILLGSCFAPSRQLFCTEHAPSYWLNQRWPNYLAQFANPVFITFIEVVWHIYAPVTRPSFAEQPTHGISNQCWLIVNWTLRDKF